MVDMVFLNIYSNLGEFISFSISSFIKQLLLHRNNKQLLQKNSYEQTLYGCWQEIPADIMGIIVQLLTLSDRIRLGLVCKSWRSLAMDKDICPAPQLPWLALPHDPNKKNLVSFYDLNTGKVHNMKLPKVLQGAVCWGCCKGWLVMSKERQCLKEIIPSFNDIITSITKPVPDVEIFLFNPISRALHQLASLSLYSHNEGYNNISYIIHKIELSSMDISECIVAAVLRGWDDVLQGWDGLVAFCRPRDQQWSIFGGKDDKEDYNVQDILFYKGSLYALTDNETKHVENHTIRSVDCEVSLKTIPNLNDEGDRTRIVEVFNDNFSIMTDFLWGQYLVESTNGELLLICRSLDAFGSTYDENPEHFNVNYQKTNAFKVFKMDPKTGHLSRLQSLGDQVLFLAYGGSQSFLAKDYLGVQGNRIYFVDDLNYLFDNPLLSRDSGVYYLEDERIERSFPSVNFPLQQRMSWFTPVL